MQCADSGEVSMAQQCPRMRKRKKVSRLAFILGRRRQLCIGSQIIMRVHLIIADAGKWLEARFGQLAVLRSH
jgi:hypothetical protein